MEVTPAVAVGMAHAGKRAAGNGRATGGVAGVNGGGGAVVAISFGR
jgi:hypothetical protein